MSQENVEIVRRIWEAWVRGDMETVVTFYAPEIEMDFSHFDWPEESLYRGLEAVRGFLDQFRASWDRYESRVEEFIDADDRVVIVCWQGGRGNVSGAEVERAWAQIYTVRNGKAVRIENYSDRAEALEAVGLQE